MQLVIDVKSKRRIAERLKKATVDKSYLMKEASNISEYIEKSKFDQENQRQFNQQYHGDLAS